VIWVDNLASPELSISCCC